MHTHVTGGAGYIGSHACIALLEAGHRVTVLDNLYNSSEVALAQAREITGQPLAFVHGDIRDAAALDHTLQGDIDAVIHFIL
ncbi:MAG: SDR family NAD(P)-dependent oxidoreductase [Xanthomonadales bacterium]|nr:SDR family NAD(P)-dependent oxidoreductase [Xanthomonadales bacterium]